MPGCTSASSCCSAFCDVEEPDPGCITDQECTALFSQGQAPPGAEAYGVCALPTG